MKFRNRHFQNPLQKVTPRLTPPPPTSINGTPVQPQWTSERKDLSQLSPTGKDLLTRLLRNTLPLGVNRQAWGDSEEIQCPLCQNDTVETAVHLFWECPYASSIWNVFKHPWRTPIGTPITWDLTQIGTGAAFLRNTTRTLNRYGASSEDP